MLEGTFSTLAVTPESLDDFALENSGGAIWVQAKSKIRSDASFAKGEIADIIIRGPGDDEDERWVVLDRPVTELLETVDGDACELAIEAKDQLLATAKEKDSQKLQARLHRTKFMVLSSPMETAVDALVGALDVSRLAARACWAELLFRVGEAASENARSDFATRKSETTESLRAHCNAVLSLIDVDAVEEAIRLGVVTLLTFNDSIDDPEFFRGVSATAGHVAAGLAIARPVDSQKILANMALVRNVLVCGPSGAGKSALCYLAAFESRHFIRWVEISEFSETSREASLSFLKSMAPSVNRPVGVYVDDVGRGGEEAWRWLCALSQRMPGIWCLGSVREEDLALVGEQADMTIVRPSLTEVLATAVWDELRRRGQTKTAHWLEAFEQSKGLFLEFVHILTQGKRLHDLISDQVDRRLREGRDDELHIMGKVANANRRGAAVNVDLLRANLRLSDIVFARAYQRLRNEHLIGELNAGNLIGLHEIRSQTITEIYIERTVSSESTLTAETIDIVAPADMRRYLATSGRDGVIKDQDAMSAVVRRLGSRPSYDLLVEALEAFRLRTISHDAEVFHAIAKDLNISHRHYLLCLLVMYGDIAKGYAGIPAFKDLTEFHGRFQAHRAEDIRSAFFTQIPAECLQKCVDDCSTSSEAIRLAAALHGDPLKILSETVLTALADIIAAGPLSDIAEFLAILYDYAPEVAREMVKRFGGSETLLERLWRETDWALKPETSKKPDGRLALTAHRLAFGESEFESVDKFIFDHAAQALQLCPEAAEVTSHPLQASGEVIAIKDYTPGLKKLQHENVMSRAAVSWNRMIIHEVARSHGATSRTEVIERFRFSLEEARRQMERAFDYASRGKKFTARDRNEALSLHYLEELLPTYPLTAPEDQFADPLAGEISDPIGTLVVSIAEFLVALIDREKTGFQIASYLSDVIKSAPEVRDNPEWAYSEKPPVEALDAIEGLGRRFRPALVAAGQKKLGDAKEVFTKHRDWRAGTGLDKLARRLDTQASNKLDALKTATHKVLGATLFAKGATSTDGVLWPEWDCCIVKPSETIVDHFIWLESALDDLRKTSKSAKSLAVVPVINGVVPVQLAVRIYDSLSPLPDEDFGKNWEDLSGSYELRSSETLELYQKASSAMVNVYAAQTLLGEKLLTSKELSQIEAWAEEAGDIADVLSARAEAGDESAEFVLEKLVALNDDFKQSEEHEENSAAISYAQSLMGAVLASRQSDAINDLAGLALVLIGQDLDLPIDSNNINED